MTQVDLIIPTLNGSDHLRRCLESLRLSTFTDFNLIVWDDGSTEPIADLTHASLPDAKVMRSETNVGLAVGFNRAIAATSSPYVVLLNNDTEVESTWLAELVACADSHPESGSIASKMLLLSDRHVLHSTGDGWHQHGMPFNRGVWLEDFGQYDCASEILLACGGAALYRRAALAQVLELDGFLFDEALFMYLEDVDLGWRLQSLGWECSFAPDAVVYHALSATGGGPFSSYHVSRNIWRVMRQSVPREFVCGNRRRIAAFHMQRALHDLRHVRETAARASLRGTLAGLAALPRVRPVQRTLTTVNRERIRAILPQPLDADTL